MVISRGSINDVVSLSTHNCASRYKTELCSENGADHGYSLRKKRGLALKKHWHSYEIKKVRETPSICVTSVLGLTLILSDFDR